MMSLGAAGDHRLDDDPGEPARESCPPAGAIRAAHLVGPVQVELDRARVALVHQAGHVGLEHHMAAEPAAAAAACPARSPSRDGRPAACRSSASSSVGLGGGQPAAAGHPAQERADQRRGPRRPAGRRAPGSSRRPGPPCAVPGGPGERPGGALRVGVGGHGRPPPARGSSRTASGWSRTTAASGTGSRPAVSAGTRSAAAVGHDQREHRVHPAVAGHDSARQSRNALGADRGGGVHRPADGRAGRQHAAQPVLAAPGSAWPLSGPPRCRRRRPARRPRPALDTTATRLPAGTGWLASSTAASSSSPRLVVAMIPPARTGPHG